MIAKANYLCLPMQKKTFERNVTSNAGIDR